MGLASNLGSFLDPPSQGLITDNIAGQPRWTFRKGGLVVFDHSIGHMASLNTASFTKLRTNFKKSEITLGIFKF